MAGSSITGAASPCEKVSCINSQCRRDLGLLTLYSLSCPWMVSRCTRVQVSAMAVLFKTLILTSVGAALGSEHSGIKHSVRQAPRTTLEVRQTDRRTPLCPPCHGFPIAALPGCCKPGEQWPCAPALPSAGIPAAGSAFLGVIISFSPSLNSISGDF